MFCLLYATINAGVSGLIITYSKLSVFSMSDALTGWFLAVPWMIRALTTAVLFPALLKCLVQQRMAVTAAAPVMPRESHDSLLPAVSSDLNSSETAAPTVLGCLWLIRAGALLSAVIFSLFGLANSTPVLFVFCSVEGFASIWDPAAAIALSSLADCNQLRRQQCRTSSGSPDQDGDPEGTLETDSDQGSMLGLRAFLQLLMACVAPLVFNEVYDATVDWQRPFTFYVLALFCTMALIVSFTLRPANI